MIKYKFFLHDVYSLDECGLTTIQDSPKTYATTGKKKIGNVYLLRGKRLASYHNMCNKYHWLSNIEEYVRAFNTDNIVSDFKCTCIYPFNSIFVMMMTSVVVLYQIFIHTDRIFNENEFSCTIL